MDHRLDLQQHRRICSRRSNSAIFAPYKATVTMPRKDTTVTLTLKLVYNGREDLNLNMVYTILFKG